MFKPVERLSIASKVAWIFFLCSAFGYILWRNSLVPSFVYKDLGALYNDGHYIASVAKNIVEGHGVSYWDGIRYRFLDPEISTGPVVFLPLAAALYLGVDEWTAFNLVPIFINLVLLAWILFWVSTRQSLRVFVAWSFAVVVVSLTFQRWQWRLPLGEVPAVLFLLLAFVRLDNGQHSPSDRHFSQAGMLWALAVLSKAMVLLAAPAIFAVVFASKRRWRALLLSTQGALLIFLVYALLLLILSPSMSAAFFLKSILGYFQFNFNFGIYDWFSVRSNVDQSVWENMFGYAQAGFSGIPAIGDAKGYAKAGVMLAFWFLVISVGIFLERYRHMLFYAAAIAGSVLLAWYFLAGQHDTRYFFIVGYAGAFLALLFFSWLDVHRNKKVFILIMGALVFGLLGRGVVFQPVVDFSRRYEAEAISSFLNESNIPDVLGSLTLVNGYPEIAFYLDGDIRYLNVLGYLRRHAEINQEQCSLPDSVDLWALPGPLSDPLFYCQLQGEGTSVTFRWKTNDPGYLLKKVKKWEVGNYKPECGLVVYQNTRYILMRCSKKELAGVIARQTEGRFVESP